MREHHRFLGLDLSGAKNDKSSLTLLEFYPRENKTFVLEIYEKFSKESSPDQALLDLLKELKTPETTLCVNAPLTLPPCLLCKGNSCTLAKGCSDPSVRWMHNYLKRSEKQARNKKRMRPCTPYTQRPIELWMRYDFVHDLGLDPHRLGQDIGFEIDETMGGTKAPLTCRMQFLLRALKEWKVEEVWPKLSMICLARAHQFSKRILEDYRFLDSGIHAREQIIHDLSLLHELFIYEKDQKRLAHSLSAFDSFLCALTGWLAFKGSVQEPPKGFPVKSGWILFPKPLKLNLK